ncbi:FMN-binding protein [Patescibacteria group bacterium]|nr:FMN-binding protein [Patescibacteria group bacterium]
MKKLLLSGGIIIVFIIYGLHQRQEGGSVHVVAPPNLATLASPTPPPTASPSPLPAYTGTGSTATNTPVPSPSPTPTPAGMYKNGTYTGSVADAYYGNVQVAVTIRGGKISAVQFLQYPNDRSTSREINAQAMPYLQQEAIQAQSAQVDGVSGASDTSAAFIQSLSDALSQAQ